MELRTSYVIRHKKRASTTPDWLREKQEHAHARMHVLAISVDAFPFLPCLSVSQSLAFENCIFSP